jgi:Zn-dependent peptidase ImmA (M78 family)
LGDGPIADVLLLMESKGIIVARADFDAEALDAFSCWVGPQPFVFLSADRTSAARSRYDAAHELGHLILHQGVTSEQMEDPDTHDRVEREANRFAAAFLLPAPSFRYEVNSVRLNAFLALKKRWKVSIGAMVHRCLDIGLIGQPEFVRLRKQMSSYGYIKREPLDDEIAPESRAFCAAAWICWLPTTSRMGRRSWRTFDYRQK